MYLNRSFSRFLKRLGIWLRLTWDVFKLEDVEVFPEGVVRLRLRLTWDVFKYLLEASKVEKVDGLRLTWDVFKFHYDG